MYKNALCKIFILGKFNLKSNWTLAPEATENWKIMAQLKAERIVEIFISHIFGKPLKSFEKSAHSMIFSDVSLTAINKIIRPRPR